MLQIEHLPEGTRIRLSRIVAGMTLYDVGRRAGVSPSRLSEFERGRCSGLSDADIARVRAVLAVAGRDADNLEPDDATA